MLTYKRRINLWILKAEEKKFGKNKIDIYDTLLYNSDRQFLKFLKILN